MIQHEIRERAGLTTAREDLLAAGLAVFDRDGFEGATVASGGITQPCWRHSTNPAARGRAWRG